MSSIGSMTRADEGGHEDGRTTSGAAGGREVLRMFSRGGMPARATRTPDEDAQLVVFRTLHDLVSVLEEFRRRVERGEAVRLFVAERRQELGRAVVEIEIVPD
jgi:hypothetical protein